MEHEVVEKSSMHQADQPPGVHDHPEPASQPNSEVVDTKLSPVPAENGHAPVSNPHHNQPMQVTSEDHNLAQDPQTSSEVKPSTTSGYSEDDSRERGLATEAISQQSTTEFVPPPQLGTTEDPHIDQANHAEPNGPYEFPNHQGITNLEIDSDETDSAIGDMTPLSSTASLRSSIYDVVKENGRTYHRYKEGKYLLPNDESEQERLDLQHHLCSLSLDGKLHLAPTGTDLRYVLDIGTGTGIWAIEFALQHPDTTVIGSDLSPIQPNFVPLNCRFEVDDAEDVWAYSHKFDYVHGRMLFSCFKDPAGVIASAYKALEPGRYFELMDVAFPMRSVDDSLNGTALGKWCTLLIEGAKALGKDWTCTSKYPGYFEDAGFVDIQVVRYHWPTNAWAKSEQQKMLGRWLQQNLLDGVAAMSMAALTRGLKMSPAEVELFLVDVRKDIQDRHIHAYCPVDVVYGRKPE